MLGVRGAAVVAVRMRNLRVTEAVEEMKHAFNLPVYGVIPLDATVEEFDRKGRSLLELPEDNPDLAAVRATIDTVNASEK